MSLARLFKRAPAEPESIEESARRLSEWNCLNQRQRTRERARIMREEMGLEPHPALERNPL
jgi:hypothetical protein